MKPMAHVDHLQARDIAAALDWWRDAGVDCDFTDDATDWLAKEEADTQGPAPVKSVYAAKVEDEPKPAEKIDLLGADRPQDLAAFREWWLTAPGLDPIGPRGRVPPRGSAGSRLMVLVTDPEEGDSERLLSGPQGRLLDRILAAMELREDEIYLASAAPRHMPMTDGAGLMAAGYREVLMHHVALAAPDKVIAFGANILPLLGHNAAQDANSLREINHDAGRVSLLVSEGLESLLAMPRLKARFWRRWLEWTDG